MLWWRKRNKRKFFTNLFRTLAKLYAFRGEIGDNSRHRQFIFTLVGKILMRQNLLFIPEMIFDFSLLLGINVSHVTWLAYRFLLLSFLKMAAASYAALDVSIKNRRLKHLSDAIVSLEENELIICTQLILFWTIAYEGDISSDDNFLDKCTNG